MLPPRTVRITALDGDHALEVRCGDARVSGKGQGKAIVAAPHPLHGGEMSNPVVRALEEALQREGFGTLAFDYRGVGNSTGTQRGTLDDGCRDLVSVGRHALAEPLTRLAGYSFGACAALQAAETLGVTSLWLVAPPLALLEPARLSAFAGHVRVLVGEHDEYAPAPALQAMIDRLPDARLEVLPGADHFFTGSQLERLRNAL